MRKWHPELSQRNISRRLKRLRAKDVVPKPEQHSENHYSFPKQTIKTDLDTEIEYCIQKFQVNVKL